MKKTAALLAVLVLTAGAAEDGIIFRDDFRDNHNGWKEVFGLKDLKAVVENGKFVVVNNLMQTYLRQDGVLAGRAGFEIEAVFSDLKGESGNDYGLKFDTQDQKNSCTFTINGKRRFFFSSMLDGNKMPAGPGKFSEHIRYDANRLTVKCRGGALEMLVNGRLVDASDCAAAPWDRAGFIVSGKVSVDVDDFTVREPRPPQAGPDGTEPKKKKVKKKKKKKRAAALPGGMGENPKAETRPAGISLGDLPGMKEPPAGRSKAAAPAGKAEAAANPGGAAAKPKAAAKPAAKAKKSSVKAEKPAAGE